MQEMGRVATPLPIASHRFERHRGDLTGGQTAVTPARAARGEAGSTLLPIADELILTKTNQLLHILSSRGSQTVKQGFI